MSSCAVATCKNTHRNTKGKGVIFHVFPKNNPDLCKQWLNKCRRKDEVNVQNARICSEHFLEEDYEDDMKNRLLGLPAKKNLKPSASPKVKLPSFSSPKNSSRKQRQIKRITLKNALEKFKEIDAKSDILSSKNCSDRDDYELQIQCSDCEKFRSRNMLLKKEIKRLEIEIRSLRLQNRQFLKVCAQNKKRWAKSKSQLLHKIKLHINENRKLKSKVKNYANLNKSIRKIFTKSQVQVLATNNLKMRWTTEDISRSIVIRALSSKSYDFWKNKMGIPLPSVTTLKRWCSKFSCAPGVQTNVLKLMKQCNEHSSNLERICVLSFDEMHVSSTVCYDCGLDRILGPSQKVQFVLVRGLASNWKQPVFYDFDVGMTKKLLFEIIKNLESVQIEVKAIVSDLGGSGALWKELEISPGNNFFMNPEKTSSKIFVFADLAHYIKLLRNHFIDKGLKLEDGTVLNLSIIEDVLNKDSGEIKLCHKLKPSYLTVKGNDRQKVTPAKVLFSSTTANAILHFTANQEAHDFFKLVDDFFDIMNSNRPEALSNKPLKAAFGNPAYFTKQYEILLKMKNVVTTMRVCGKKSMLPFQKGIIISIDSLLGLYEDVKSLGMKYLLTSRLTQDVLESLFSQIRGLGRFNDHPTPTEVIRRLKQLLMANKLPKLSTKACIPSSNEEAHVYLTSELLNKAFNDDDGLLEQTNLPISQNQTDGDETDSLDINMDDLIKLIEDPVPLSWEIELNPYEYSLNSYEKEALTYIAGYIAYRIRDKDPSLGKISSHSSNDYVENSDWIYKQSMGGLTVPSPLWMESVYEMDKVFCSVHGPTIRRQASVISDMIKELQNRFPNINKEAVRLFARLRTFIRIRYMNRKSEFTSKRKAEQKMKKWIQSKKVRNT